jgi:hypothetical protein
MKPTTLLFAASLVANVALVAVFYSSGPTDTSAAGARATAKSSAIAEKSASASRSANASSDAQGSDATRDAALGRAFARFAEKMRAAQAANTGDGKWWRNRTGNGNLSREQMAQARRELSDAMIAAFGDDIGIGGVDNSRLAFLPAAKRDALRNILSDYDELLTKFGTQGGPQLASDKEKLKLLNAERNRDIAALLSPAELADYEMRTSATANTLRTRYGDGIASEEEFKKIYALQKAYDEKFPQDNFNGRMTPEMMNTRGEATLRLQADLRAAVGEEAYAALKRASDNDLRQVDALAARLNLPPDTTDRVAVARDSYAAESQRIMSDPSVPFQQRREQLQALAARAKTDLTSTLGAEAADAYAQRSQWMSMLQGGMGYSTTPPVTSPAGLALGGNIGQSVYPVMPAGAAGGGTRQIVNFVGGSTTSAPTGGAMLFPPADGNTGNVQTQVFSVSTTATTSSDGRSPTDTVTTVVAPALAGAGAPAPPATPAQKP